MTLRNKNILDKIGSLIPGYSGYAERSDRRNNEKIFRVQNSLFFDQSENNILEYQKKLISLNKLDELKDWEILRKRINTLSSKFKNTNYGESSFFSSRQIKEEELIEILSFDEKIASIIQLIQNKTIKILEIQPTISEISDLLNKIETLFLERLVFISNYK
jgi:hypothetical protein